MVLWSALTDDPIWCRAESNSEQKRLVFFATKRKIDRFLTVVFSWRNLMNDDVVCSWLLFNIWRLDGMTWIERDVSTIWVSSCGSCQSEKRNGKSFVFVDRPNFWFYCRDDWKSPLILLVILTRWNESAWRKERSIRIVESRRNSAHLIITRSRRWTLSKWNSSKKHENQIERRTPCSNESLKKNFDQGDWSLSMEKNRSKPKSMIEPIENIVNSN